MKRSILGIDLGTSSVKLLLWNPDGTSEKIREGYEGEGCEAWVKALKRACQRIDKEKLGHVEAVGLTSQVGTYIVECEKDRHIISWSDGAGKEELVQAKRDFTQDEFLKEIHMPHPDIISYPVPRLLYITKHFENVKRICQPKDYFCEVLTGNRVSDPFSWRGLAVLDGRLMYSEKLLAYIGVKAEQLPKLQLPVSCAGKVSGEEFDFLNGVPVYVGCNDFFAGLLGAGIKNSIFDITGTSEHIGVITQTLNKDTTMVNGPYFKDHVYYGGTASSGVSMNFCMENFMTEAEIERCLEKDPPLFLPYLNGERAPIWDAKAQGVYLGINGQCGREEMAYAVMEGIVFSLYHIYEHLNIEEKKDAMIVTGGAAQNQTLNRLKAELFDLPVKTLKEKDTTVLGAVMIAAVGTGIFENLDTAAEELCEMEAVIEPCGQFREMLLKRFEIYKKLYPSLQSLFIEKRRISE
ncbi:MAG: hypothetical protein J5983_02145 [Ruminococcus sp.]|nr:hypothetical protein [Ruminococcus sp.]